MEFEISLDYVRLYDIRERPGYIGAFTNHQAKGAIPNGKTIIKIGSKPGDLHTDGSRGTVLGSIYSPAVGHGYWVEWHATPRVACFVVAERIREPG